MLIDTHAHLYLRHFDSDREAVVERAKAELAAVVLPNVNETTVEAMNQLADAHPRFCFPALGLHPCNVREDYAGVLRCLEKRFDEREYVAVGETGLDYYHDRTFCEEQKKSLAVHLEWAKDMGLPVIIHCRESFDDAINMVEKAQDGRLTGVFHCFTGTECEGRRICDAGFFYGIGGVLTYPKSTLADILPCLPKDRMVLETDAPYLPPVPHRGKRNESAYVRFVAEAAARALNIPTAELIENTGRNALCLFPRIAHVVRPIMPSENGKFL
ncbi:MAG: TatD family hydrolase [Bacteroidia bacterium]|nr:TatD family hydrolase [Bacteroidia bacterium]MDW8333122.1 TatD family hydrolase [Bacteroidia bacterium]